MIYGNRNILDPVGWSASSLEWGALWWVAADDEVLANLALFELPFPLDVLLADLKKII